ncbi:hypothetical protein ACRPOS_003105 [Bartonella heixiaziensis]
MEFCGKGGNGGGATILEGIISLGCGSGYFRGKDGSKISGNGAVLLRFFL